jgi:LysM repeat protein
MAKNKICLAVALISIGVMPYALGDRKRQSADSAPVDVCREIVSLSHENRALKNEIIETKHRVEGLRKQMAVLEEENARFKNEIIENYRMYDARLQDACDRHQANILEKVNGQIQELVSQVQKGFDQQSEAIRKIDANTIRIAEGTRQAIADTGKQVNFSDKYPLQGVVYETQEGDSLSVIAKKLHSSVKAICNANHLENPDDLKVGQILFIPENCEARQTR